MDNNGPIVDCPVCESSASQALLTGVITEEQKQIVQNNIDDYIKLNCVMSRHSLDIIQKLLDAC
jgi:hypothetical protein